VILEKYVIVKFDLKSLNLILTILIAVLNFKNYKHYNINDFNKSLNY
jgi:hypothetical protein